MPACLLHKSFPIAHTLLLTCLSCCLFFGVCVGGILRILRHNPSHPSLVEFSFCICLLHLFLLLPL